MKAGVHEVLSSVSSCLTMRNFFLASKSIRPLFDIGLCISLFRYSIRTISALLQSVVILSHSVERPP